MTKHDVVFMNVAKQFASLSHCVSVKVGCVAVKDGRIIATGINGTAPGYINCDQLFDKNTFNRDDHHIFSETYEIHAEMNLVMFSAKNGLSLNGCSLYVTHHPCWNCVKNLSVVGIKHIFYDTIYDRMNSELMKISSYTKKIGMTIEQLNNE